MISLYNKNETDFTHNGIVLSDLISCEIEEELNGKYILELEHLIDEKGKWKYLQEEVIVKADGQLFRIHSTEKDLYSIRVYARHIFYDLLHNFLEDVRPTNLNGVAALNHILQNTQYPHPFIATGNVETINTQYYIRKNPVEAILGDDSLTTRWKGEIERDNYRIRFLNRLGRDRGVNIYYGKNLLGLEVNINKDNIITRLMPQGRDGLLLPEKYIDSKLIGDYAFPYIKKVDFNIGVQEATEDQEEITEEEAIDLLRQEAIKYMEDNKVDVPDVNIKINLLLLENTEEYKDFKQLEKIYLGDTVSISKNPLGLKFESRVVRVRKDILTNKNIEIELGNIENGLGGTFNKVIEKVSSDIEINKSELEKAIDRATELLTNALGGYVLKREGELLIMDKEDPYKAEKIWRWNLNGLGYSRNGVDGPYELAMTIDGEIVADFITTGVLDASLIKVGTIKSKDGTIYANLDNNTFMLGGKSGDVVEHSNQKSVYKHEDGSYTEISSKGLYRYDAGVEKEYHYMTKIIKFSVGADGQAPSNRWIPIGPEFNNKKWTVALSISDSMKASSNEATMHRIVLTQGHDSNNIPLEPRFRNGQWEFPVMGYKTNYNWKNDSRRYGPIAGIMIVTA